jgi:hypothetical protein
MLQPVVVNLVHQRQQAPDLAGRKTLARKPVEVVARQVRQDSALVLDLPPVDVPIGSGSPGCRLLDGFWG